MATKQNVLSHIIRHSAWPHVQVAYVQTVEVDGESFTKPSEVNLDSPAVMKAAKALEDAVLKEIDAVRPEIPMASPSNGEQAQRVQDARAMSGTASRTTKPRRAGAAKKR
jgi:hypothetical protein